jgi:Na+/H+ antiporter NhaD/arsenite permease-like protein
MRTYSGKWIIGFLCLLLAGSWLAAAGGGGHGGEEVLFPLPLESYVEVEAERAAELGVEQLGLFETLKLRVAMDPFNLIATLLFFGAILHTFFASKFMAIAHRLEEAHEKELENHDGVYVDNKSPVSHKATLFHFLGEVEVVFGLWLIPLSILVVLAPGHGWHHLTSYVDSRNYTEPLFVIVIMAIASSRPVIALAEGALSRVASLGKGSPLAWWFTILTVAPLLGSFITEPAAMTIAAMLLGHQFYRYEPSMVFRYATLGLLFVNISVGGTLTHFAAPPVLMVADTWHWDMVFMFTHFGWRAVLGIFTATFIYFIIFRKHFAELKERAESEDAGSDEPKPLPVPMWITAVHLFYLGWTVFTLHHPAFFIGGFLFFLGFTIATDHHQYEISLKTPLLVGFFLAGLVTHGGLQSWWIAPVLSSLTEVPLFIGATLLTAFNDNAAITYLASLVPAFSPDELLHGKYVTKSGADLMAAVKLEYAVVAGAVTGGGLTVIANAPNPAGQSLLRQHFGHGVSPLHLFAGAALPTVVMAFFFMVLPH